MINVMLVDDQMLVREGIKSLLALTQDIKVVAEASDGEQVLTILRDSIEHQTVDVILMDISMPVKTGIEAVQGLQGASIDIPVIMLTTFDDHQLVLQAIQSGAKGYLLKDVSLETLVDGIKTVHQGKTLIQPAITERIIQGLKKHAVHDTPLQETPDISEKEKEVLRLMASGYSNREISNAMHKSEGTVKNQVSAILGKLGVRDRTRAVLKAIEIGMI
ncbi:response regulator transcription factor [Paraglaciecola sp. MB-3u-78]|uniref:response regulator transcription factor n=1 Tax=Paraglaciecola sp. MB-3u-78 TaxID=2058332 RepID=UPI000C34DC87|nr:response regulator transcription factor [Paraglaciecola sp. MB-3u-78]PKG93043.1 DNA-binding response regulator [Paraglaciecola sp. MB-3u-78]